MMGSSMVVAMMSLVVAATTKARAKASATSIQATVIATTTATICELMPATDRLWLMRAEYRHVFREL